MIYHIIISQNCLGFDHCRLCESVEPGISAYMGKFEKVMASERFMELNRERIERLVQCCPKMAISTKRAE